MQKKIARLVVVLFNTVLVPIEQTRVCMDVYVLEWILSVFSAYTFVYIPNSIVEGNYFYFKH